MSLATALLRRHDPEPETRAIRDNDFWGAWGRGDDWGGQTVAGVAVNRPRTLGISSVWACVNLIASTIATLPWDTYTEDDNGVLKKYTDRPAWLDKPNPEQTSVDFRFGTVASLLLDGSAFIYTDRDRKGDVAQAWVLDPNWVQVRREFQPDGSLQLVYYVMVAKGQQSPVGPVRVVAGPEMFHVVAFQSHSGYPRGLAPLEVARMMFASAIAGEEMGTRFFGQGMNASGVLQTDADVTIEQARELKKDFANAAGGLKNMHLPPLLSGGLKWQQIQISPEQAQFLEQRQFSKAEIATFFGVPPHMIGDVERSTSWGTGIAQQNTGFVTYTLRQWLSRIEEAFSQWMLLFDQGAVLRFDVNGLLRGDPQSMASYYQTRFLTASATPNEIRAAFGEEPLTDEEADKSFFPVTSAPMGTEPMKVNKVLVDTMPGAEQDVGVPMAPKETSPLAGTPGLTATGVNGKAPKVELTRK